MQLVAALRDGDTTSHDDYELRYTHNETGLKGGRHIIEAHHPDDGRVGQMEWMGRPPYAIHSLTVSDDHQRKGLATAMWDWSQTQGRPKPTHSRQRTDKGDAWAKSVGGKLPRREASLDISSYFGGSDGRVLRHHAGRGKPRRNGGGSGAAPQGGGRGAQQGGEAGQGDSGGQGLGQTRSVEFHPRAVKDLQKLDGPMRNRAKKVVDALAAGDEGLQTHALYTNMKGWYSTKVNHDHRIVHRNTDDGGLHIVYVGLHGYDEAARRLGAKTLAELDYHQRAVAEAQAAVREEYPTLGMQIRPGQDADDTLRHMLSQHGHPRHEDAFVSVHDGSRSFSSTAMDRETGAVGVVLHPARADYGTLAHEAAHLLHDHQTGRKFREPAADDSIHGIGYIKHYAKLLEPFGKSRTPGGNRKGGGAGDLLLNTYYDSLNRNRKTAAHRPVWADDDFTAKDGSLYHVITEPNAITMRTPEGHMGGYLTWGETDGVIGNATVRPDHQRKGLATEMLRRAKEQRPDLEHSHRLSNDAQAWIGGMEGKTASAEEHKPLPTKLFHVTTARDDVLEHGLKTRDELGQRHGHGFGSGRDDTISLTNHEPTAEHLLHSLHEYHDVLNGKIPLTALKERARNGVGAKKPYDFMFDEHDHSDERLAEIDSGHVTEPKFHVLGRQPEGWTPKDEGVTGQDGSRAHMLWHRPLSENEKIKHRAEVYGNFAWGRQASGGHMDPLFMGNSPREFAKKDPSQFALLHVRPQPGAHGIQMNDRTTGTDAGEWRALSGHDLRVVHHEGQEDIPPRVAAKSQRWYHGTGRKLDPGAVLQPGLDSHKPDGDHDHVWLSDDPERAGTYGDVYEVHVQGEPVLTHKGSAEYYLKPGGSATVHKFVGNPKDAPVDAPEGTKPTIKYTPSPSGTSHRVDALHGKRTVGNFGWDEDGVLGDWVHPDYRDSGLRDQMVQRARRKGFTAEASHAPLKSRIFGPTHGLDHRLFEGEQMKLEVRTAVMDRLGRVLGPMVGFSWREWSKVYMAGSEASEWTSEALEGNNDFDTLIGVDYGRARELEPEKLGAFDDERITWALNVALRFGYNASPWVTDFGTFDLTGYCNPDSYDITKIKPYAAYNITDDVWAVRPPHLPDWSVDKFPQGHALLEEAEGYASVIEAIDKMPEPYRTQQGKALWEHLHGDRSRAFSDQGEGWLDPGNTLEKALNEWGLWDKLVEWKYGKQHTAAASSQRWGPPLEEGSHHVPSQPSQKIGPVYHATKNIVWPPKLVENSADTGIHFGTHQSAIERMNQSGSYTPVSGDKGSWRLFEAHLEGPVHPHHLHDDEAQEMGYTSHIPNDGRIYPYVNETEDEGSTSFVAPRRTLRSWREIPVVSQHTAAADPPTIKRGVVLDGHPVTGHIKDGDWNAGGWDPEAAHRLVKGTATHHDILKHLNTNQVGHFWYHPDHADIEDAQSFASPNEPIKNWMDDPAEDGRIAGEVGVVMEAHHPKGWDPDEQNPSHPLMGNSYLPDNSHLKLHKLHYTADGGENWHTIPVEHHGITVHTDGPGEQKTAASAYDPDDDDHYRSYTDWDKVYPRLPEDIHRGMAVQLPADAHDAVHDTENSEATRAHALLGAVTKKPLGMHWSSASSEMAGSVSHEEAEQLTPKERRNTTHVVLHADRPERHHIEDDIDRLVQHSVISHGRSPENEVPLKEHAPVHIWGVSWKHHDEPGWHTHELDEPMTKTAMGAHGDLPEGIAYKHNLKDGIHVLTANHPDMPKDGFAGLLSWWENDGEIGSAEVHPHMQRRGLATELLRRAKEISPHVHHSDSLTDDAKGWISGMDKKAVKSSDHELAPDIPQEQHDALSVEHYQTYQRKALELAKKPVPGTHMWRAETRSGDPVQGAHETGVGMHWSVNPDGIAPTRPRNDDEQSVVYHAELEHPGEQNYTRDHPMWHGRHMSMDHEAEVRLKPGSKVKLHGVWTKDPEHPDPGYFIPRFPERMSSAWKYHPIGKHVDVAHRPSGGYTINYGDVGIGKESNVIDITAYFKTASDDDYRMMHRPPDHKSGQPLHEADETGDPDEHIRIYRSAPAHVDYFDNNTWATTNPAYAHQHGYGEGVGGKDWPVMSAEVPKKHVFTDHNDENEVGYQGPRLESHQIESHDEETGTHSPWESMSEEEQKEEERGGNAFHGMGVHLPPADHAFVHDKTKPIAERAHRLFQHVPERLRENGGYHWEDEHHSAEIDTLDEERHHGDHPTPVTQVVVHGSQNLDHAHGLSWANSEDDPIHPFRDYEHHEFKGNPNDRLNKHSMLDYFKVTA